MLINHSFKSELHFYTMRYQNEGLFETLTRSGECYFLQSGSHLGPKFCGYSTRQLKVVLSLHTITKPSRGHWKYIFVTSQHFGIPDLDLNASDSDSVGEDLDLVGGDFILKIFLQFLQTPNVVTRTYLEQNCFVSSYIFLSRVALFRVFHYTSTQVCTSTIA